MSASLVFNKCIDLDLQSIRILSNIGEIFFLWFYINRPIDFLLVWWTICCCFRSRLQRYDSHLPYVYKKPVATRNYCIISNFNTETCNDFEVFRQNVRWICSQIKLSQNEASQTFFFLISRINPEIDASNGMRIMALGLRSEATEFIDRISCAYDYLKLLISAYYLPEEFIITIIDKHSGRSHPFYDGQVSEYNLNFVFFLTTD